MVTTARNGVICQRGDLLEAGPGIRFIVVVGGERQAAFAIRFRGQVYAYRNACAHQGVELDWDDGRFFDVSGTHLVCSMHGALYAPDTGVCRGGPCHGRGLIRIGVIEFGNDVRLEQDGDILVSRQPVTG